jgi:hypothetical protein
MEAIPTKKFLLLAVKRGYVEIFTKERKHFLLTRKFIKVLWPSLQSTLTLFSRIRTQHNNHKATLHNLMDTAS